MCRMTALLVLCRVPTSCSRVFTCTGAFTVSEGYIVAGSEQQGVRHAGHGAAPEAGDAVGRDDVPYDSAARDVPRATSSCSCVFTCTPAATVERG